MKNKRYILILFTSVVLLSAIFGVNYINNLPKETTWGEMLNNIFSKKNSTVIGLTITEETPDSYTDVKITDEQTIKDILEGPAMAKLKEADVHLGPDARKYLVIFRTDTGGDSVYMNLSENLIHFHGSGISYETDDDSIFKVIHEAFIINNN